MKVWRLFPAHFRQTAFTGIGGLYAARRWNHLGTPIVYCATSPALAALEFFVHLEPNDAPDDLLLAEASIPDDLIEQLDPQLLPPDWRELNSLICRDLGSDWARRRRSLALLVPSAVVAGDSNLLVNPSHPGFNKVAVAEAIPFRFDSRMFR
jgi:RES domain-containing protein